MCNVWDGQSYQNEVSRGRPHVQRLTSVVREERCLCFLQTPGFITSRRFISWGIVLTSFHLLWRGMILIEWIWKPSSQTRRHLGRQSWELYAFAVLQTQQVPVGIARVTAPFSEQFSQSQAAGESLRRAIKVPTTLESWGAMFSMSLLKSSITACSRGCWIRLGAKRSLLTVFEMCILGLDKWMGRGGRGLCSEISCSWMYFSAILNKYAMVNVYLAGVCGYWLSIAAERRKKHRQNAEFLVVSNAVFRNKLLISCST